MLIFQTVTYQTVIVTDFSNTYVEVTYEYMNWVFSNYQIFSNNFPVRFETLRYVPDEKLDGFMYSYPPVMGDTKAVQYLTRLDLYSENDLGIPGGSIDMGRYYFQLTDTIVYTKSSGYQCSVWLVAEKGYEKSGGINRKDAQRCPPYYERFNLTDKATYKILKQESSFVCLEVKEDERTIEWGSQKHSRVCCYTKTNDASNVNFGRLMDTNEDVVTLQGLNLYQRWPGGVNPTLIKDDPYYYTVCCGGENIKNNDTTPTLCAEYLNFRPICSYTLHKSQTAGKNLIICDTHSLVYL